MFPSRFPQKARQQMAFAKSGYNFTEQGIASYAPRSSGVYGIYNSGKWIYIGEAGDIEARLYAHLRRQSDQSACIHRNNPTHFAFEEVEAAKRVDRERALIRECNPVCNQA